MGYPKRSGFTWVACLVMAVLIVIASSCADRFELAALAPDQVPAEIREQLAQTAPVVGEPVFRACYRQDGRTIVVMTWKEQHAGKWTTLFGFWCFPGPGGWASDLPEDALYRWGHGGGGNAEGEGYFKASGIAFVPRAATVVGTTSLGKTVEGPVVNGFWCLIANYREGEIESVVVRDDRGKMLHTFLRP